MDVRLAHQTSRKRPADPLLPVSVSPLSLSASPCSLSQQPHTSRLCLSQLIEISVITKALTNESCRDRRQASQCGTFTPHQPAVLEGRLPGPNPCLSR